MVVQYNLRRPATEKALISVIGGNLAMLGAVICGFAIPDAALIAIVAFTLVYCVQKLHEEISYTTLTYFDEEDTERLREALLKVKQELEEGA